MEGCICKTCGTTKHKYDGCKCIICGNIAYFGHKWENGYCKICGKEDKRLIDELGMLDGYNSYKIKELIESGADVNHKDDRGQSPLYFAIKYSNEGWFSR